MLQPGSDEVRKLFRQSEEITMVNHGSYGLAPIPVMEKRFSLVREQEEQPDVFFRINLEKYYTEAVVAAAGFVGADIQDLFVVDNATTGTNSVLKSLKFDAGSEMLLNQHTYLAVRNTAAEIEENHGLIRRFLHLPIPILCEDDVVDIYEKTFMKHPNIKIAILDHITSPSAILMPIKRLIALCRKFNVIAFVDGAHAPGQIKLDMNEIGADFYVGNFHKWAYSGRACGFLWISPAFRGKIRPVITSNAIQTTHHRFGYMGTRDYTPFYTLTTALKFYESLGGVKAITKYADELVTWAQAMLCEALGTKPLDIPCHMRSPCMAVVGLPPFPKDVESVTADEWIVRLWQKYSVQTSFTTIEGKIYVRLSANVYNCKNDYIKLRDALLDLFEIRICTA